MSKKKQINAERFSKGAFFGTVIVSMLCGTIATEIIFNITNSDAAINSRAQHAYEDKMDEAERVYQSRMMNNTHGVKVSDDFDIEQATSTFLKNIAPIKMAEAQEEAEKDRLNEKERALIDVMGGVVGGLVGCIVGMLRPLTGKKSKYIKQHRYRHTLGR